MAAPRAGGHGLVRWSSAQREAPAARLPRAPASVAWTERVGQCLTVARLRPSGPVPAHDTVAADEQDGDLLSRRHATPAPEGSGIGVDGDGAGEDRGIADAGCHTV